MGFRFRKSLKVMPGVRLNLSKSGVGISAGVPGARVSVGPRGVRRTLSIPGTGISHSAKIGTTPTPRRTVSPMAAPSLASTNAAYVARVEAAEAFLRGLSPEQALRFAQLLTPRRKRLGIAYLTWLVGLHYLYLGRPAMLALFWLTFGGFGIWWMVDFILLRDKVSSLNGKIALMCVEEFQRMEAQRVAA